jgi:hypothetical protein
VEIGPNPCRNICLATDLSGIAPGPVVRFDGALGPEPRPLVVAAPAEDDGVLRVDDRGHVRVHHVVVPVGEELVGILGHAVEGHAQALVAPQPLDLLVVDVPVTPESLEGALRSAAEDLLMGPGLRRVELSLPADDLDALRAVLRAGFRLEGVRRQVLELPDGSYADLCLPARPASDQVGGSHGFTA